MKRFINQSWVIIAITGLTFIVGCKKNSEGDFNRSKSAGGPFTGRPEIILEGSITQDMTLSPGTIYKLKGIVFVTGGAKLTIEPGTVITAGAEKSYRTSPAATPVMMAGVLVITRGASIDAAGTPAMPIVFTTSEAVGARNQGNFGGIIILGKSVTNQPSTTPIAGLPAYDGNGNSLGVDMAYGGAVAADNSGIIQYVRIEYGGYRLTQDTGINGLTFGGVGSGTTVDHVQVSCVKGDAFAFSGGTVNARYLIALDAFDDDFDIDNGYTGHIQYAIGLKDPSVLHSVGPGGTSDANGIESDNDGTGSSGLPKTKPVCSNFTLLGDDNQSTALGFGNRWRRNTDLSIQNSIIAGYNTAVDFSGGTQSNATPGGFSNNQVHAYTTLFSSAGGSPVSLIGSTNILSTSVNPDLFIGLGSSITGTNLSPFYTSGIASVYTIDNLYPRDISSTKGAVTDANYSDWASGWLNFTPQTSMD